MGMPCDAICDPTVTRQFDQTAGRYNDRSAFANNAAQDNFNHTTHMHVASAMNQLEQNGLANMIVQMRAAGGSPASGGTPT